MGIAGLWPFLRKKGYDPTLRHFSSLSPIPNQCCIRVDILGSLYMAIRSAYSSHPLTVAHSIVEQNIQKLGDKTALVLYLDGGASEEKRQTQLLREGRRKDALDRANTHLKELELRVVGKLHVRKHHFLGVRKNLSAAYAWPMEARQAFAEYLRSRGWNVVTCDTEADIRIAFDCRAGDVVVSRDSDMLMYRNITTIWRPISYDRFLVYELPGVLTTLGIDRTQFTALGIVSRNDYNRNIYSLGSATNFSIIKELAAGDVPAIVSQYLADNRVARKNTLDEDLAASQRVFVTMMQTPLQTTDQSNSPAEPTISYEELR
ncbi:hypothetical protein BGZ70_001368, partial [Mortierella alpina]